MAIKNILAVRNDRFGEFLLNIPAFRALKESYPGSRLSLVVNPYVSELAEAIDCVDEVLTWEGHRHRFGDLLKFSRRLKDARFELCVVFNPSKEFNLISFLAGIPRRVGYNRKWGILLTQKMPDRKYLGLKHEVEYNLELAALAGANTPDRSISLNINSDTPSVFAQADALGGGFILVAIHPWTSDPLKQWPLENFSSLAARLSILPNVRIVAIGGKEELAKSAGIFNNEAGGFINLTGKTSLKELASVLKRCSLLISGDSGPVHLAAAVGTPALAIFGTGIVAKGARRWGPWGAGHAVVEKSSLREIGVEEVYSKAEEMLKNEICDNPCGRQR